MDLSTLQSAYPWFKPLLARFRAHLAVEDLSRDSAHDLSHSLRVARLAHYLSVTERADGDIAVAAALLHDLVWVPKNHRDSKHTAEMSAKLAPTFCSSLLLIDEKSQRIADCILTHSFSGGGVAASLEAQIVQDADRLDAIGAIGIARAFNYGGFRNNAIYIPDEVPNGKSKSTIGHFYDKLLNLKGLMNTETGKRLAGERHNILEKFLEQFYEEWNFGA